MSLEYFSRASRFVAFALARLPVVLRTTNKKAATIPFGNAEAPKGNYRADIDGLRAIAILPVVAFHAFPKAVPGGFIGVDIFFVISGFLISGILLNDLERGSFSLSGFYGRRIRRIFPTLILVLLTCMVMGWFVLLPSDYEELARQVMSGGLFASNFLFWQEAGYFDGSADAKPLLHLWSLGVEEQFYIVWPLMLYVAYRFKWKTWLAILTVLGLSLLVNLACVDRWQTATYYLPFSRLWELALGGLLAWWFSLSSRTAGLPARLLTDTSFRLLRDGVSLLGAAVIVASMFAINRHVLYPGWRALMPVMGAASLIVSGEEGYVNRNILKKPLVVFVGLISYPLYMWHWPLLSFLRIRNFQNPKSIIEVVAVSIVAACLTYAFIEKPIRHMQNTTKRTITTRTLVIISLCLVCAGGAGVYTAGMPMRLPPAIRFLGKRVDLDMMNNDWRREACFFIDPASEFSSKCVDSEPKDGPLLAVWGDSNAASLYPGLRSLQQERRFRVAQFTVASCPPIIGFDDATRFGEAKTECASRNQKTLDLLESLKPDILVLQALWFRQQSFPGWPQNLDRLEKTISVLRQSGIKRIILVGSVPVWTGDVQGTLRDIWLENPLQRLPIRTNIGLADKLQEVDDSLRELARRQAILFLPPRSVLCNAEGCLTRLGDSVDDLITWDDAHFTVHGSRYFAREIAPILLDGRGDLTGVPNDHAMQSLPPGRSVPVAPPLAP